MLEVLAINGAGLDAFGESAEVFGVDKLAGEVEDSHSSVASLDDVDFHRSVINCGVGVEADGVVASRSHRGDVEELIRSDDFVGVVNNVGGIHEDTAAIGAEIHCIGPFGVGEDIRNFGNTIVVEMLDDGVVIGNLVDSGDRHAVESAIRLPAGVVHAGSGEDTFLSSNIEGTSSVLNNCGISGGSGGQGDIFNSIVIAGNIVDINHVSSIVVEAVESDDNSILTFARIDGDRGDAAIEEIVAFSHHKGIGSGDAGADLVVHLVADLMNLVVIVDRVEAVDTDQEGLLKRVVLDNDDSAVAILRHDSVTDIDVGVGGTVNSVDVAPETGVVALVEDLAEIGWEPTIGDVGVLGHIVLNRDSEDTAQVRLRNSLTHLVLDDEAVVEDVAERIGSVGGVEDNDGVASLNSEIRRERFFFTVTIDFAEGIEDEGNAVVRSRIVVSFPEIDLSDSGAAGDKVGSEHDIACPGLGVGVVRIVGVCASDSTVLRRDEERTARDG